LLYSSVDSIPPAGFKLATSSPPEARMRVHLAAPLALTLLAGTAAAQDDRLTDRVLGNRIETASDAWRRLVEPVIAGEITDMARRACASNDRSVCNERARRAVAHATKPIRATFDRCAKPIPNPALCAPFAIAALKAVDYKAAFADAEATAERERIEREQRAREAAERAARAEQEAIARAKQQAIADKKREREVMGDDAGTTFLRKAYDQRRAQIELECRRHSLVNEYARFAISLALPDHAQKVAGFRAEYCHAHMRAWLTTAIPGFNSYNDWGRMSCATEHGDNAWRCIDKMADTIRGLKPTWHYLENEMKSALTQARLYGPGGGTSKAPGQTCWHEGSQWVCGYRAPPPRRRGQPRQPLPPLPTDEQLERIARGQ
jgi:hypothetical protein